MVFRDPVDDVFDSGASEKQYHLWEKAANATSLVGCSQAEARHFGQLAATFVGSAATGCAIPDRLGALWLVLR